MPLYRILVHNQAAVKQMLYGRRLALYKEKVNGSFEAVTAGRRSRLCLSCRARYGTGLSGSGEFRGLLD